jgi:hypothetical protein
MWNCPACGEEVDDQFDVCWNCQATQSGRRRHNLTHAGDEDNLLKSLVNKKHKPMNCLRCSRILDHAGTRKFHQGPNLGALGDWGELFVGQESLEMYVCRGCGHIEFFTFED